MRIMRRKLLTDSAAAVGAASVSLGARVAWPQAPAPNDSVGIQLWSVGAALQSDVDGTLRKLRAIGFKEVEPAGFAGLSAAELRKRLDDAGLIAPSAHLPLGENDLEAAFADAHTLGARYAVSATLRPGTGPLLPELTRAGAADAPRVPPVPAMTLEDAKRTADLANRIGELAKRAGLRYAYHNHHFEFARAGGVLAYDELLRRTDAELVKFEMDCGWVVTGGQDPVAYFEQHPGRFPLMHVKDFLPLPTEQPTEPDGRDAAELRGTIDYRPIFAAAHTSGLEHFFAEQEGPFTRTTPLEAAEAAYAYLRRVSS
jgi:sugar phosphate isomerase/epimerase